MVMSQAHCYSINGALDGPLFLKSIIVDLYIDTRATASYICLSLAKLDEKIVELDTDITKFNQYVCKQQTALLAHGKQSTDLLVDLFTVAYLVASDAKFTDYIKQRKNAYKDGRENYTVEQLMEIAKMKYDTMKLNNTWNKMSKEQ